jgi:lipid-binding SYLF domain-containing protein
MKMRTLGMVYNWVYHIRVFSHSQALGLFAGICDEGQVLFQHLSAWLEAFSVIPKQMRLQKVSKSDRVGFSWLFMVIDGYGY